MAMITAWLSGSPELLDTAIPPTPVLDLILSHAPDTKIGMEHRDLRNVAVELSLLCATAMSCWADSIGVSREDLLRDIAVGRSTSAADI